jgi:hypothetical protein
MVVHPMGCTTIHYFCLAENRAERVSNPAGAVRRSGDEAHPKEEKP